jgi:hypothetical protein
VVVGLLVLMLLSMSFFIERTSALHQFTQGRGGVVTPGNDDPG